MEKIRISTGLPLAEVPEVCSTNSQNVALTAVDLLYSCSSWKNPAISVNNSLDIAKEIALSLTNMVLVLGVLTKKLK